VRLRQTGAVAQERAARRLAGIGSLALFIGTVFAANWAIERYGAVPVGFGLEAPAGVYFAGLAFTFRDGVRSLLGRRWVAAAIVAGSACSAAVSPTFALASGVAFLVSETADALVYEPLRDRDWTLAVLVSNAVGLVVDSALFLWLAFRSLEFLTGQVVGKGWMTLAAVGLLAAARAGYRLHVREAS
jgi:uncharacterized PurR-regulated membrane protein YhhQ (DUF165 family)